MLSLEINEKVYIGRIRTWNLATVVNVGKIKLPDALNKASQIITIANGLKPCK